MADQKFCINCGGLNPPEAKFCATCGAAFVSTAAPPPETAPLDSPPPQPPYSPSTQPKRTVLEYQLIILPPVEQRLNSFNNLRM
jgi:hypothetical protein